MFIGNFVVNESIINAFTEKFSVDTQSIDQKARVMYSKSKIANNA